MNFMRPTRSNEKTTKFVVRNKYVGWNKFSRSSGFAGGLAVIAALACATTFLPTAQAVLAS